MQSKLHKLFLNHCENEKPKFSAFLPLKFLSPFPAVFFKNAEYF